MKSRALHILLLTVATLIATGCSADRYLGEGECLLHHIDQTVVMVDSSAVSPEVTDALKKSQNYYLQRPNSKFLGMKGMTVGMWMYCVASPEDSSFWGRYWHNLGQAPVIYDESKAVRTAQQLGRYHERGRLCDPDRGGRKAPGGR